MCDGRRPSSPRKLGQVMDGRTEQIGLYDTYDLCAPAASRRGSGSAFANGRRVNLIALYGLDDVLADTDWRRIAPERKAELQHAASADEAAR